MGQALVPSEPRAAFLARSAPKPASRGSLSSWLGAVLRPRRWPKAAIATAACPGSGTEGHTGRHSNGRVASDPPRLLLSPELRVTVSSFPLSSEAPRRATRSAEMTGGSRHSPRPLCSGTRSQSGTLHPLRHTVRARPARLRGWSWKARAGPGSRWGEGGGRTTLSSEKITAGPKGEPLRDAPRRARRDGHPGPAWWPGGGRPTSSVATVGNASQGHPPPPAAPENWLPQFWAPRVPAAA